LKLDLNNAMPSNFQTNVPWEFERCIGIHQTIE